MFHVVRSVYSRSRYSILNVITITWHTIRKENHDPLCICSGTISTVVGTIHDIFSKSHTIISLGTTSVVQTCYIVLQLLCVRPLCTIYKIGLISSVSCRVCIRTFRIIHDGNTMLVGLFFSYVFGCYCVNEVRYRILHCSIDTNTALLASVELDMRSICVVSARFRINPNVI